MGGGQLLGQNSLSSPELLMESSFPGHKYHPNSRTLKFLKLITLFFSLESSLKLLEFFSSRSGNSISLSLGLINSYSKSSLVPKFQYPHALPWLKTLWVTAYTWSALPCTSQYTIAKQSETCGTVFIFSSCIVSLHLLPSLPRYVQAALKICMLIRSP